MIKVASTSLTQMSFAKMKEDGTLEDNGHDLRFTGESLEQTISKEVSAEIDPSRQNRGMFLTDAQVAGSVNFELSAEEFSPMFASAMMDKWSDKKSFAVGSLSVVTYTPDQHTSELSFEVTLPEGDVFGTEELKGKIVSLTMKDANLKPVSVMAMVESTALTGTSVRMVVSGKLEVADYSIAVVNFGRSVSNGVTKDKYTLVKSIPNIPQHFRFDGMAVGKLTLSCESKAAVTGSLEFVGETLTISDVHPLPATEPSFPHPIIDAVLGMDTVYLDRKDIRTWYTAGVKSLSLDYDNSLQGLDAIGKLGNIDTMVGTINLTGAISMYFNTAQAYEDTIKQRRFELTWCMFDRAGKGYAVTVHSAELNDPQAPIAGKDQPLMIDLSYQGMMHPELRKTITITEF